MSAEVVEITKGTDLRELELHQIGQWVIANNIYAGMFPNIPELTPEQEADKRRWEQVSAWHAAKKMSESKPKLKNYIEDNAIVR